MLEGILFGLALGLVLFTAGPILWLRAKLIQHVLYDQAARPRFKISEICATLIQCPQCSLFWISIPLWYVYPLLPQGLIYAIYVCALVTLADIIKYRFL